MSNIESIMDILAKLEVSWRALKEQFPWEQEGLEARINNCDSIIVWGDRLSSATENAAFKQENAAFRQELAKDMGLALDLRAKLQAMLDMPLSQVDKDTPIAAVNHLVNKWLKALEIEDDVNNPEMKLEARLASCETLIETLNTIRSGSIRVKCRIVVAHSKMPLFSFDTSVDLRTGMDRYLNDQLTKYTQVANNLKSLINLY